MRVPFGCEPLDALLGGGVESGAITEIYGEAASGKTNACLQLARNVAAGGGKVAYIDTEGVSLERFAQICGGTFAQVQKAILFFEPFNLREQEAVVDKASRLAASAPEIGIIILDSATLHYRLTLSGTDGVRERRILAGQLQSLANVARKRDIPVVVTNQVYTDVETDQVEPLGGQLIRHITKTVVRFEKAGIGRRKGILVRSRSLAEGAEAHFRLTAKGIEGGPTPADSRILPERAQP
ncbi:MAG: DNA repair and recombination protein RadB [Thermoplasmatota archaeon]